MDLRRRADAELRPQAALAHVRLGDPTDPAWLLVEEAAWRVEAASLEAARFPARTALAIAGGLGIRSRAAVPAVGVVVVAVEGVQGRETTGVLRRDSASTPTDPEAVVFLTPHREGRSAVPFAMIEAQAPVVAGWLQRLPEDTKPVAGPPTVDGWEEEAPAEEPPRQLVLEGVTGGCVTFAAALRTSGRLRVCFATSPGLAPVGDLSVQARDEGERPLPNAKVARVWSLRAGSPHPGVVLDAFEILVPVGASSLEVRVGETTPALRGIWLNPIPVINAPRVADGRYVELRQPGVTRVDFVGAQVAGPEPLDAACSALEWHGGRPPPVLEAGGLTVGGRGHAWPPGASPRGTTLDLDPTGQALLIGVRSPTGEVWDVDRTVPPKGLTPSMAATVNWVRCTDGADGCVEAGAISIAHQREAHQAPTILWVMNPLPFGGGLDREKPAATIVRAAGAPYVPLRAFEAEIRRVLVADRLPWMVRLWTSFDATLAVFRRWEDLLPYRAVSARSGRKPQSGGVPVEAPPPLDVVLRPEVLYVHVGPKVGPLTPEDVKRAENVIQEWFSTTTHARRGGVSVQVGGLRALTVRTADPRSPRLPTHGLSGLPSDAVLVDGAGVERLPEPGVTLVDAVVVDAVAPQAAPWGAPRAGR